ncbi:hypothetical protein J3B02_002634 [Coemansia erecta]|uniref:RRM domain-containing protein n=1 Tax=Coemansia asiatica TaxID=1052880 RepID=A0A9W7XRH3_9FUNG|nr:hypothetical protein LPJ64_000665 [Coemansia asiatica]KAJ2854519.1 hypothetical protein J3B02_002634 [Coemansia erecta]KAJ2877913.1 hypothetical protein FB639_003576 [Coemansia asiatica]
MSLFSGLPAIDSQTGGEERKQQQKGSEQKRQTVEKSQGSTVSWSYPELAPNLRRPKASYKPTGNTATTSKHPHSLPRDPASLISRWNAVSNQAETATLQTTAADSASIAQQQEQFSLAEYMPVIAHIQRKPGQRSKVGSSASGSQIGEQFDPFEEYSPAVPSGYHAYKQWLRLRKKQLQLNSQRFALIGEPSACIMLTNMADETDDSLERETEEECRAFGHVVKCKALVCQGVESPFERVRLYVEFEDMEAASRAREALDRRFFDGRHISATFVQSIPDDSTDHSS